MQDAFTRLMAAKNGEIQDERGWLIVVTSRLCLDQITSARSRRERAHDASEIEFAAPPQSGLADPADRVTFDDTVRLALLVVLQQLSRAERPWESARLSAPDGGEQIAVRAARPGRQ